MRKVSAYSQQISQLDQAYNQNVAAQETLIELRFPMYTLTDDLASQIPSELDCVSSFQMTGLDQVALLLEETETTMAQTIVENIEEQPYVIQVQFLHAQSKMKKRVSISLNSLSI